MLPFPTDDSATSSSSPQVHRHRSSVNIHRTRPYYHHSLMSSNCMLLFFFGFVYGLVNILFSTSFATSRSTNTEYV